MLSHDDNHSATKLTSTYDGFKVEHFHLPPGAGRGKGMWDYHAITIALGPSDSVEWEMGNEKRQSGQVSQGDIFIWPAKQSHWACRQKTREYIRISLTPAFVASAVAESVHSSELELLGQSRLQDPLIQQIGFTLNSVAQTAGPIGRLYTSSLTTTLAIHLLQHYSAIKLSALDYSGSLSPSALRRSLEYINDNLTENLSLADIASSIHLSPYHFGRLFKQSTGYSPHQYVIQQRVARAKELLALGETSVAEVATQVGFVDQSHLNRHFKRLVGVTPGSLLRI